MNFAAVDKGGNIEKVEVPKEWANIQLVKQKDERNLPDFVKNVMEPIVAQNGDDLPVSAF